VEVKQAGQHAASEAAPAGGNNASPRGNVAETSVDIVQALEAALEALREEALGARDDKRLAVRAVHEARAERAQVVADLEDEIDGLRDQVEHLESELEELARQEASVRRTVAAAAEQAAAAAEDRVLAQAETEASARVIAAVEAERARARGASVEVALQTEASFLRRFDAAEGALPAYGPAQVCDPPVQLPRSVPVACGLRPSASGSRLWAVSGQRVRLEAPPRYSLTQ
jgi:TolA-binding protein